MSADGAGPFHFGPYGFPHLAGDWSKTPWSVDDGYLGRILVRGRRVDGTGEVAFGFWPQGFGTPAEQPGVPVVFRRPDVMGRTVVYQAELDIDSPAGGRVDVHFWSFHRPAATRSRSTGMASLT